MDMIGISATKQAITKAFGILFAFLTAFTMIYFGYRVYFHPTDYVEMIELAILVFVCAYITYNIHLEINSRERFAKDEPLYRQVEDHMRSADFCLPRTGGAQIGRP